MYRIIIICLLIFICSVDYLFSSQDAIWTGRQEFGNVTIDSEIRIHYDEIEKVAILGKLAELLSMKLNYKEPIFIDVLLNPYKEVLPKFFMSYDINKKEQLGEYDGFQDERDTIFDNDVLIVRQVNSQLDIISTLKLIEFGIKNIKYIKQNQKRMEYIWRINTIDTSFITIKLLEDNSSVLDSIKSQRINRILDPKKQKSLEGKESQEITYFWKNSKYHIYWKNEISNEEFELLQIDNIFIIKELSSTAALVFDTDSTFYYVSRRSRINKTPQLTLQDKLNYYERIQLPQVSKQHIIKQRRNYLSPFKAFLLGKDKVIIFLWFYVFDAEEDKTLVYIIKDDLLIQSLDELIDNSLNSKE